MLSTGANSPRHPGRRWVRRAGATTIVAWAAWVVAMNLVLSLHLIPRLVNHNPVVTVDYDTAWTLWPGTVNVRGFTLRGHDRENVEFGFDVQRGFGLIDLLALPRRTFRAMQIRVDGLDVRFRGEFDPPDLTKALAEGGLLPPLGYPDPPMKQLGPEPPPVDDAHDQNWTVDLRDVQVRHLRQIWLHELRFQIGDAHLEGHFYFHPDRVFELGLSPLDFADTRLTVGTEAALLDLTGTLVATTERFDPRTVAGHDFLRFVSARLEATGELANLHVLRTWVPTVGVSGGNGPLQVVVHLDHGLLTPGTWASLRGAPLVLGTHQFVIRGPLLVDARVRADSVEVSAVLQVELSPLSAWMRADRRAMISGQSLRLHLRAKQPNLASDTIDGELTGAADHLEAQLGPWVALLTHRPPAQDVRATGNAHVSLQLPSLRGQGHAEAQLARGDGWWAQAELHADQLALEPRLRAEGWAHAHARDAAPLLEVASKSGPLPSFLTQALMLPNLDGHTELRLAESELTLSPIVVSSGDSKLLGTATLGDATTATLLLHAGPLAVGVSIANGQVFIDPVHGQATLDRALRAAAPDGPVVR